MQTSITKSVTPTSKLIIINILCKKSNIMLFLIIFKIYINTSNVINISIIAIQKKETINTPKIYYQIISFILDHKKLNPGCIL
jgi:hypothetical protein